eukprot:GILI01021799.1.p1 GENE.GILI01021799.1~~GILI01021799.1.p1  ORF type:complete len:186 (+),score=47.93 GILI01021799.1:62-619(+)
MKINAETRLEGEKVVLVPYLKSMVPKYHSWMQDPFLLETTASEPLTLEEEYENQVSWMEDAHKCTFIILDRSLPEDPSLGELARGGGMAGDVNFFLNDLEDEEAAEIEIMIAEVGSRRKGLASEALHLMMDFGHRMLGVNRYVAKIGDANTQSMALFRRLGFQEVSHSECFQETTFEISYPLTSA